jgi:hypothetical protein
MFSNDSFCARDKGNDLLRIIGIGQLMVSTICHEKCHSPIAVFNDLHYLIEIEVTMTFGFEEHHKTRYSMGC